MRGGKEEKSFQGVRERVSIFRHDSHTHSQRVGEHTPLPLWHHHHPWQRATDNREKSEGKLSLSSPSGRKQAGRTSPAGL